MGESDNQRNLLRLCIHLIIDAQQSVYNKLLKNILAARNTSIQHTLLSIKSYVKGCKKEQFQLTNQDKFQRRRLF